MDLGTPALLFGAISLLLLAYTNRFLVIAKLIRDLHTASHRGMNAMTYKQIPNLRRRVQLTKYMQTTGVCSFILCTLSTLCLFIHQIALGKLLFGGSVIALLISLSFSLYEVIISTQALDFVLDDIERLVQKANAEKDATRVPPDPQS